MNTQTIKWYLAQEYSNETTFFPSGKYRLVHLIDINPCTFSIATLHGYGLRNTDLTKTFGKMLKIKLQERWKGDITWPLTPEELLSGIDVGTLPEIYSTIYFSIYESASISRCRHATTSHIKATKIWSLACNWEEIITKQLTSTQIVLGMVLCRMTSMNSFSFNLILALLCPWLYWEG